jgi:predicted MFS family arabinose efflux permease
MDPFLQSLTVLGVSLATLAFLVIFVTPVLDRFLDRFERRRHLPPAE